MARLLSFSNILLASTTVLLLASNVHAVFQRGAWRAAKATFYGSEDGTPTGGACGYNDTRKEGFGVMTTALSIALYKDAEGCGSCYEIECDSKGTKYCKKGDNNTVSVTATDLCPDGGYCPPPKEHFDLAQPAFLSIAEKEGGVIPVRYRKIPCPRKGGIRVTIDGNPNFNLVSVSNVGGSGDVSALEVRAGKKLPWTKLRRNWGQKWETDIKLVGHKLTFKVTTADNQFVILYRLTDKDWKFGKTYQSKYNFI